MYGRATLTVDQFYKVPINEILVPPAQEFCDCRAAEKHFAFEAQDELDRIGELRDEEVRIFLSFRELEAGG